MFIKDGIVYGTESFTDSKRVTDVKVLPDHILLITFNNLEQRVFDATVLNGAVFEPLKNNEVFSNITIEHGVITWQNGEIDCAPEYMYEHSYEYIPEQIA